MKFIAVIFMMLLSFALISNTASAKEFDFDTCAGHEYCFQDEAVQLLKHRAYRYSYRHYRRYNRKYYRNYYKRRYGRHYRKYYRRAYRRTYNRYYRARDYSYQYAEKKKRRVSRGRGLYGLSSRIAARGYRLFVFSPRLKLWAAYNGSGRRVAIGRANGGAGYCADIGRSCRTPVGMFRIYSKGSPYCKSSKFPRPRGGAPMPYCMFFRGGYAIHGSPYISNRNTSHGCIRVKTGAARWLHGSFISHGTKVLVLPY